MAQLFANIINSSFNNFKIMQLAGVYFIFSSANNSLTRPMHFLCNLILSSKKYSLEVLCNKIIKYN